MIAHPEFAGFPVSHESEESPVKRLVRITEEKGALVPQNLLADALGISKARVSHLLAAGRFEVVDFAGAKFVPAANLEAFMAMPKDRGGRPRKSA
jgi:hypothetical protein